MKKPEPSGMRARPMPAWAGGARRKRLPPPRNRSAARWIVPLVAAVALALWLGTADRSAIDGPLVGHAQVIDGDTLRMGQWRVRLDGIDTPELAQECRFEGGQAWPCGAAARDRMDELVSGRDLSCDGSGFDRYGRLIAVCLVGDIDPAEVLVREGLAVAEGRYEDAARTARVARIGIWQGQFDAPAEWRRAHAAEPTATPEPSRITTFLNWVGNMFYR